MKCVNDDVEKMCIRLQELKLAYCGMKGVFPSNINNLPIFVWIQVFLSNTTNFQTYLFGP